MPATPQFVRWTLPLACALRDDTDVTDPEQTERQLRSLRTYSDCLYAGRELDGVCISASDPGMGFPAAEVISAYGGEGFIYQQCDACALNVVRGREKSGLAGCFGLLAFWPERGALLEQAIDQTLSAAAVAEHFLPTAPRWIGLWTLPQLDAPHIAIMQRLFAAIESQLTIEEREFHTALMTAQRENVAIHLRGYPAGESAPDGWRLAAHCGRCKASMSERSRRCVVCGQLAHAEPSRRRKTQGNRPFVALERFLGAPGAEEFRTRYAIRSSTERGQR